MNQKRSEFVLSAVDSPGEFCLRPERQTPPSFFMGDPTSSWRMTTVARVRLISSDLYC